MLLRITSLMKALILSICVLLICSTVALADVKAKVRKISSGAPDASKYVILIEGLELDRKLAIDETRYAVTEAKTGASVNVTEAQPVGFKDPAKGTSIQLSGEFEPNTAYKIGVKLPNVGFSVSAAALAEDEQAKSKNLVFTFLQNNARFQIEPLVGQRADGLGAKFETGLGLGNFGGTGLSGEINFEGEIATNLDDKDFSRTVKGSAEAKYFLPAYRVDNPFTGGVSKHHVGVRLRPAGFESDQEFNILDFKATSQLAATVPFTDWPGYLFGSKHRFTPMLVLTGYTFARDVKDDGSRTFKPTNRWDSEIAYNIPLLDALRAELRFKSFLDLEKGDHKARFLGTLRYSLDEKDKRAITLSFKNGGDAPTFNSDSAFRVGFDIKLGEPKKTIPGKEAK